MIPVSIIINGVWMPGHLILSPSTNALYGLHFRSLCCWCCLSFQILGVQNYVSPDHALQPAMPFILSDNTQLSRSKTLQDLLCSASNYIRLSLAKNTIKHIIQHDFFYPSFCANHLVSPSRTDISIVGAFIGFSFESCHLQMIKAMLGGIQCHIQCQDRAIQSLLGNLPVQLLLKGLK